MLLISAYWLTQRRNPRLVQCWMCPGVLPRLRKYAPLSMFMIRHMGSRGTVTITRWRATRSSSRSPASGSSRCSSTSEHSTVSKASSSNGM